MSNTLNRRNFMAQTAAFVAAAAASQVAFAGTTPENHSHASHEPNPHKALAAAAALCVNSGEACLQHCLDMLNTGNTSMSGCTKTLREMMIYCDALSKAAQQKSKHLKTLAKIALEACRDCETECKKHSDKHSVCKECAESCAECIKQCEAVLA